MNPVRQFLSANPVVWFLFRLAAVSLLVWWINHSGYTEGAHDKELEWSAKWDKQAAELATARADAELAARSAEQRRQADIERVRQDAEKQIASAERDAVAADAVAVGLREQAGRLAKRASQCASDSGSAQSGDAAGQSAVVLADLLGRADARAGELAKAYDRARAAGLACQRAYLTLTNPD
jgi:chromosome segregation ATPase